MFKNMHNKKVIRLGTLWFPFGKISTDSNF